MSRDRGRTCRAAAVFAVAALAVAGVVASGCATPQPGLEGAEAVLHDPTRQDLADLAAKLSHPRLAPMTLDFSRPLTPPELAVIAVVASPDLKALRAKAGVVDAQVFSAGLLPDPVINLAYAKRLGGPDVFDGMSGAVVYELIALRQRRTVMAGQRAAAEQAHLDLAWQELQTAGQAELLAARIGGLTTVLAYNRRTAGVVDGALKRALQAQARGDIRGDEVETRRLAAVDAASALRTTEIALDGARHDLNKLLGLSPNAELSIAPSMAPRSAPADADVLFRAAEDQRLDLQALKAGYASQNAAVRKAMMDAFPSLLITLGGGEDTAHTQTFDPAANLTLPLWNRNRGGIAVAKATQAQLRADYAARLFAARADIADIVSQLGIEARQRADIGAQLPAIRTVVGATERSAARGDLAEVAAEAARQSLSDKEQALVSLDQAMAEQRVTLKLAVGGPLLD